MAFQDFQGSSKVFKETLRAFQALQGPSRALVKKKSYRVFQDLQGSLGAFKESSREFNGLPGYFHGIPGPQRACQGL